MRPDQKYMPAFRQNSDGDIKFAPFTPQSPLNSPSAGWIPILFFNNSPLGNPMQNNTGLSMGSQITLPNMSNSFFPSLNTKDNSQNNSTNQLNTYSTIMPNNNPNNTNKNQNNISNNNSEDLFPDESNSNTLYSYNNTNENSNETQNINNSKPNKSNNMNNTSTNQNDINRSPNPIDLLRDFDLDLDEDVDLVRNCCNGHINKIYKEIEQDSPGVLSLLEAYNIPRPMGKLIIRRVIKISVNHCKRE
ncbi:hypothetical protein ACQPU1_03530 [Clostridium paraputrificum]|uniref:hypothetical protein n=1 Tax=Clostridium TaxID=1485 RepID=UPI003D33AAEC